MQVILKETIPSLGKAGDMVRVANGYARNFLLPKGKAIFANYKNISQIRRQQASILTKAAKEYDEFDALATKLGELEISIPVRVGEMDRLYGSVTNLNIADAIELQGYLIDRKKIRMDEPIKALGEFEISIKLSPDVNAVVKVNVVPQESL
ncbi:MAG: 50S ribosomal protein L9 [Thermodesulfobacteriota bacterium]|nr:50S ribosomal protein L9 [Thermodesulfobacteriota bacterium]MEA3385254.1 50S ribosomal protein L9 [Thermodesulfobacteriota bacterium]